MSIPHTKKLFLIDNSKSNELQDLFKDADIEYIFNNNNLGFAKGHNLVLEKIVDRSSYHLILNPDVTFDPTVISQLISKLKEDTSVCMIAPKVIFNNGETQFTARKYPSLMELMYRRLGWYKKYTHDKEYRNRNLTKSFYPDFVHGCFMLFRTNIFVEIKGFDSRYFMYMEDADICRKIDQIGKKKMYYPNVQITHVLTKGSSKNIRLFFIHMISAIKYFKKWGFR